jgi:cytochrome P450
VEPKSDAERAVDVAQMQELFEYFRHLIELRRTEPGDGLLTICAGDFIDHGQLDPVNAGAVPVAVR